MTGAGPTDEEQGAEGGDRGTDELTCWSFRIVPSSAIRWWRTQSFLPGGGAMDEMTGARSSSCAGAAGSSTWATVSVMGALKAVTGGVGGGRGLGEREDGL